MRPYVYAAIALAVALAVALAWPERALLHLSILAVCAFVFGMWGALSLHSGIWCKATSRSRHAGNSIALTYDDGPDPESTPPLLDLLAERGVKAAFFCVGDRVRAHPELTQRMAAEGHEMCNHSDAHSRYTNFFMKHRLREEVSRCQIALWQATGKTPRYFRPPFGLVNHATESVARELKLDVIGWQVRGLDMPGRDPAQISQRVLAGVRPGGIVLLHDGERDAQQVVAATRAILDGLEERGLRAVGLGELLGH